MQLLFDDDALEVVVLDVVGDVVVVVDEAFFEVVFISDVAPVDPVGVCLVTHLFVVLVVIGVVVVVVVVRCCFSTTTNEANFRLQPTWCHLLLLLAIFFCQEKLC